MSFGEIFFRARGWTPVPFVMAALYWSEFHASYFIFGLLLSVSGEFLRISAIRYAGGATRTREVGASSLVTGGPYAHTRNPLYLGNMLIYTGYALASGAVFPYVPIIAFLFFSVQYTLIVMLEEESLVGIFGAEYESYRKAVPRIFPKFQSKHFETAPKHNLRQALYEERRTLQGFLLVWVLLLIRITY